MENSNTLYKMTKTVTHIDCPKEWELDDDYGSHLPLLWAVLSGKIQGTNTTGSVTEYGCGLRSTPMLSDMCNRQGRHFDFCETDKKWFELVENHLNNIGLYPEANLINSYLDYEDYPAVLFVDSKPGEERKLIIEKYKNEATLIIAHDTEPGAEYVYGMGGVLDSFNYRLNYAPEGKPHTTVVSNFINVCEWV